MDANQVGTAPGGTLVVGASQAGVQIATALRQGGDGGPVVIVGAERHMPYQRPPLSKAFLLGDLPTDSLAFRSPEFYADQDIEVVCGERVETITFDGTAGMARTDAGRELPFARLALTVGARPRRLAVPGSDANGVLYLRDLDDALHLRTRLSRASRVVVIGGGYIGLEAAAAVRSAGLPVTVVEAAGRLVARSVAPLVSDFLHAAHRRRGVEVHLGSGVVGLQTTGGAVSAVDLADGTSLPADLVLVGIGVEPRTELARQVGATCDGGVVVDACGRTDRPGVVAAGDCAVGPDPRTGTGRVRLESVQNAVGQANAAAASLLGREEPHRAVPWFWSDQFDLKVQIAGLTQGFDEYVVRGDLEAERFAVLYYRQEELLAVDAVNNAPDFLVVRKALGQGVPIPMEVARDGATPLKQVFAPTR